MVWREGILPGGPSVTAIRLNDDQRRAAEHLAGRLLISAGAGSGKTRVLTERSTNAVAGLSVDGWTAIGIDELLAITFTEKAAGELAERLRAALRRAGRAGDAQRVDAAWISTIHGMCSRILRASALEAEIDPGFTVLDAVDEGALKQRAFEEAAFAALEGDRHAEWLFSVYGFSAVASVTMCLAASLRTAGKRATELRITDGGSSSRLLEEAVNFFEAKAAALHQEDGPAAECHCTSCSSTAENLRAMGEDGLDEVELAEALWRALAMHTVPALSRGVSEHVDEIKVTRAELATTAAGIMTASLLKALLRLTDDYLRRFAELKQARGGFDFDDLQIEGLRYLNSEAGAEWSDRFRLTMVDEFQDTDALQLALVERLSGQNLCTVGDERQSIYGFRGANVSVYREHRRSMIERGAEDVVLGVNYRSHEQVLRFVNRLFGSPSMFAQELVVLEHGRDEPEPPVVDDATHRVEVLVANKDDRPRFALADAIARRFSTLHVEQGVPLGDMVILLRSYTQADTYADALRARGLDVMVVGGSRFFERPEVAAARALVRLIANGRDEDALGDVLCSDLCRLSDDGLLGLRQAVDSGSAEGLWDALCRAELGPADSVRAERLRAAVHNARDRLGRSSLAELLMRAFEETGMDARLMAGGLAGGQAYANLLKFVRLAASFEQRGHGGAAAFAAYLDAKEQFGDYEPPAALVRDGSDAVRIMSIHASKGLEFPVVAVPELDSSGRSDTEFAVWDTDQMVISAQLPSVWGKDELRRPSTFSQLRETARVAESEETKRLLYVAFTRAEEVLILTGAAALKEGARDNSRFRMVLDALGVVPTCGMDVQIDSENNRVCRVVDIATEDGEVPVAEAEPPLATEEEQLEWLEKISATPGYPSAAPLTAPNRLSYSALKSFETCPRRYHFERRLDLGARLPQGPTAADFGSAFHVLAQLFGEDGQPDAQRVAAVARFHGLDAAEESRLLEALRAYRDSQAAAQVRGFGSVKREAAFAVQIGGDEGFLLDGSIDVYATQGTRALIVDYKTGSAALDERHRQAYELQGRCYALAAFRDGCTSVEVLFVRPEVGGETVGFTLDARDAHDTEERLLALYRRIAAGEAGAIHAVDGDECFGCPAATTCPHE